MKKNFLLIISMLTCLYVSGNNLQISNVSFDDGTSTLSFDIEWQNSWYISNDSYDGAYIFAKYSPNGGDNWLHVPLADSVAQADLFQYVSHTKAGLMIGNLASNYGTFGPYTIEIITEPLLGEFQHFKVFGIETVFSAIGSFYAGDGISDGRYYTENPNTPLYIDNQSALTRGSGVGQFDQDNSTNSSDLDDDFPNGFSSFFAMKYKVTAQQYVDFLNCLSRNQQNKRTQTALNTFVTNRYVITNTPNVVDRNPIKCKANLGTGPVTFYLDLDDDDIPNEFEDGAGIPINHLTRGDMLAYLDWIGMRPMSDLEYEKLCRGKGVPPIGDEFAWGTDTYNPGGTITNIGLPNESLSNVGIDPSIYVSHPMRVGYSATSTSARVDAGATYIGIMDMHNLGEIMFGSESTDFTLASTGDGNLSVIGNFNTSDWLGAQFLTTYNLAHAIPNSISSGKYEVLSNSERSANVGFRGVIKVYPNL